MSFFTTQVEKAQLIEKIRENPELLLLLQDIQPDEAVIDEYAKKQLEQKNDDFLTVMILGEQGSGKSGLGQKLAARYAKNPFSSDRITLQYDRFIELVADSKKGDFTILDELVKVHGVGSTRLSDDIVNIVETLRKNGASIILISPTEKIVNEKDVHLTLTVLGRDGRTLLVAWKARTEKYLGVFKSLLDWNSPLWLDYTDMKNEYIEQAKKLNYQRNDYELLARKVMEHPDWSKAKQAKQKYLVAEKAIPNLTIEEKKLVLAQIAMFE